MKIIEKWFGYRRKTSTARVSSPLNKIHSETWTPDMTGELLDLLNVLGRCVALEPRQAELLDRIRGGPQIELKDLERAGVIPIPSAARKPPTHTNTTASLF
ncbi:MAG: hypothetical protein ACRD0K_06820 [Egibacteraceae bacterium]